MTIDPVQYSKACVKQNEDTNETKTEVSFKTN